MTTGLDAAFMYDSGGLIVSDPALNTWVEATNVRDATLNGETGTADGSTRANSFRQIEPTLKDGTVDVQLKWLTSDLFFQAVRNAWLNRTKLALYVADANPNTLGSGEKSEGLAFNAYVVNFSRSEPLEDIVVADVSFANGDEEAQWYTVTGV